MTEAQQRGGVTGSGQKLLTLLLRLLALRLELFSVELQAEIERLLRLLLWLGAGVFLGALSILWIGIALLSLTWNDPTARIATVGTLGAFCLGATIFVGRRVWKRIQALGTPFAETIRELGKDVAWLHNRARK
ncbi:phage holin family protein [Methylacidimicrobium sp. B4]|uniref:phage holin family protein n=1 Tax=Methylacidimicrobium sp. B4 TaxID=2796139 RepID=UPI001A90A50C|nr:phage holin family protein [Methylacidimicrobium sp. B4]QSR83872.1 phage holin family protein [Methylacidimicrobium sp. B4]